MRREERGKGREGGGRGVWQYGDESQQLVNPSLSDASSSLLSIPARELSTGKYDLTSRSVIVFPVPTMAGGTRGEKNERCQRVTVSRVGS